MKRLSWEYNWCWGSLSCVSPGAVNLQADLTRGIQPNLGRTNQMPAWCKYLRARLALRGPRATILGKWRKLRPRGFFPSNVLFSERNVFFSFENIIFHSPQVLNLSTHYLPHPLKISNVYESSSYPGLGWCEGSTDLFWALASYLRCLLGLLILMFLNYTL